MANLIIRLETKPTGISEGQLWHKLSTGQIYVYSSSIWIPWQTVTPISFDYPLTVFIKGVKITSIKIRGFKKSDVLTSAIDSCSFVLEDINNTVRPQQGEEIEIFRKSSLSATPEKEFAGEISAKPMSELASGQLKFSYDIKCVDYSWRLKKNLAAATYTGQTAGYIIKDLIDTYSPDFSYNNVQDGIVIAYIAFNYEPIFDCIKEVVELIGYDWYVDYNKDIHAFASETNTAPYSLTEDGTTGHYKDLNIDVDKSQLRNRILVRGGYYLSDLYTQDNLADGTQTSFPFDYSPRNPISVLVDSGAGYVSKTLGIDNIHTSGYDFVYNVNEKVLKNLDHATLGSTHKIRKTYKYEIEVLTQDDDDASIAAVKTIEGGDGIYEYPINDTTIETLELAHDRALLELNQYGNPTITGSFKTDQHGYRSGQILTLDLPTWGYERDFLIRQVTANLKNDNQFEYTITFATQLKGLTDFLKNLYDNGKEVIVRSNEIVHELAKIAGETITITESVPTFEEQTPPYKWSNDAGTTENKGVYNEAQYA